MSAFLTLHRALCPTSSLTGPTSTQDDGSGTNACLLNKDQRPYLQLRRYQFALTNNFAVAAYALQGQTLPSLLLDLAKPPYEPGQLDLYVSSLHYFPCCISIESRLFPIRPGLLSMYIQLPTKPPAGRLLDRMLRLAQPGPKL